MKRFQFLLAAAVVIAVGSSFTALSEKTTDQIYVDVNGIRTPLEQVEDQGDCQPGGEFCKYTLDGDTPVPLDSGKHWEMDN